MDADSKLALAWSPELLFCLHVASAVPLRLMQLARVDGVYQLLGKPSVYPLSSRVKAHWGQEVLGREWRGLAGARGLPCYSERVSR